MTVIAVDINQTPVTMPTGAAAAGSALWTRVRPDIRRAHTVATDTMAALGKRRDLAGKGRNEHEDFKLAAAWLHAYDTRDLVLVDAQHLGSKVLGNVVRFATDAGVDLWLLHRAPTSDIFLRALTRHASATKSLEDVPAAHILDASAPTPTTFPVVPRHDVHQFRTAVESTLPDGQRETVLAQFEASAHLAHRAMADASASTATIRRLVEDLLLDAPGDDELITRIRGLQLAAWHHDVFISVDLDTLLNSEERPTLAAAAVDDALIAYRQPHRIITVALTRRGHSLDAIAQLHAGHVIDNGRRLRIGDEIIEVPRAVTHALRVARSIATNERLLPHAPQTLAACLTDATKDLGLHVKGRRAERTRPGHTAYLERLGLTVRSLS